MRGPIIYDNEVHAPGLHSDWGFSCLIQREGTPTILFDTGADGSILLHNMDKLAIDPLSIDVVAISHAHWDHTGGLSRFLDKNKDVRVYIPESCAEPRGAKEVIRVKQPLEICSGVFSTGELRGIEQSLAVKGGKGLALIAGCSHPGVENILSAASHFGTPYAVVGGLHGFSQFDVVKDLSIICPCHCTRFKREIRTLFPEKYVTCGAGKAIQV